jgi:phage gp36-like protein
MAYCTLDDIQGVVSDAELIQLTDDTIPPVAIIQANVDKAIARADELIDGYLRGRYTLPLSSVSGLLRDTAVDIAAYHLFKRKKKAKLPEAVSDDYKNALKILESIQSGKIALEADPVPSSTPTVVTGEGGSVTGSNRVFTRDSLRGL